jgi:hypothetical protein
MRGVIGGIGFSQIQDYRKLAILAVVKPFIPPS